MKNIMLDLETLGVTPGAAILSIGAVEFDFSGKLGRSFYRNVSPASCEAIGLRSEPSTVAWWERQSAAAKDALMVDRKSITEAVAEFAKWLGRADWLNIWSHGAAFDTVILEAAFRAVGAPVPWRFVNVRDTRTVFDLFDLDLRDLNRAGTHHNALDDAKFQAIAVAKALAKGRAPEPAAVEDIFA